MSKRRKYSAEFKRQAVRLAAMPDVTLRQVAKDLGISEGILGRWKRDLGSHGQQAFVGRGHVRDQELMRTFQSSEFAQAFQVLRSLRDDVSSTELLAKQPEVEAAVMSICAVYETIGVLVFRGILPFQIVEDLTGGAIVMCWRKLRTWIEETRL